MRYSDFYPGTSDFSSCIIDSSIYPPPIVFRLSGLLLQLLFILPDCNDSNVPEKWIVYFSSPLDWRRCVTCRSSSSSHECYIIYMVTLHSPVIIIYACRRRFRFTLHATRLACVHLVNVNWSWWGAEGDVLRGCLVVPRGGEKVDTIVPLFRRK